MDIHRDNEMISNLLDWYHKHHRLLPWRETTDPYCIWISEIMLQQTRVETALEYYQRFLKRFPNLQSLASASEEEVLQVWQGLGYYSRARNLHKAACYMQECHQGCFPHAYEEVIQLPGIGSYTAGAIMSIAYNQPYAAVDGNVLRVIARLYGVEDDITLGPTRRKITSLVEGLLLEDKAHEFTQAWMELGALVCTPRQPACASCPIQYACFAYQRDQTDEIPVKKKARPAPVFEYWVAAAVNDGRILLEYRQDTGLLENLWGLPMVPKTSQRSAETLFEEMYHISLAVEAEAGCVVHEFTHRIWDMTVLRASISHINDRGANLFWKSWQEVSRLAVPTAFRKVLQLLPGQIIPDLS